MIYPIIITMGNTSTPAYECNTANDVSNFCTQGNVGKYFYFNNNSNQQGFNGALGSYTVYKVVNRGALGYDAIGEEGIFIQKPQYIKAVDSLPQSPENGVIYRYNNLYYGPNQTGHLVEYGENVVTDYNVAFYLPSLQDAVARQNGQTVSATGYYGLSSVRVNIPSNKATFNENGEYSCDGRFYWHTVEVNVPLPDLTNITIESNGVYNAIACNVDGWNEINVAVPVPNITNLSAANVIAGVTIDSVTGITTQKGIRRAGLPSIGEPGVIYTDTTDQDSHWLYHSTSDWLPYSAVTNLWGDAFQPATKKKIITNAVTGIYLRESGEPLWNSVDITVAPPVLSSITIGTNGTYNATTCGVTGWSDITVAVSPPSLSVLTTSANGTYNATDYSTYGWSQVVVTVPQPDLTNLSAANVIAGVVINGITGEALQKVNAVSSLPSSDIQQGAVYYNTSDQTYWLYQSSSLGRWLPYTRVTTAQMGDAFEPTAPSMGVDFTAFAADGRPTDMRIYGMSYVPRGYFLRGGTMGYLNGVTNVTFDNNVSMVYADGFAMFGSLQHVDLSGMTQLGATSFQSCTKLTDVVIGRSNRPTTVIHATAFTGCSNLTTIQVYPSGLFGSYPPPWSATNLRTLTIGGPGYPISSLGSTALRNCANLTSIIIYVTNNAVANPVAGKPWGCPNASNTSAGWVTYLNA